MRIGYGYDVHRLEKDRDLILGGVKIEFEKGLQGHSDADVLIHAIIDSILGALAKGDIGMLFPDSDEKFKSIDSRILLHETFEIMKKEDFKIGNLDSTICAEKPKFQSYFEQMRKNIATDLQTEISNISIKATTEEKLGFTGEGKGISATAVVLLQKI